MSSVVHVKGISAQTSEKEVRDFFSFCGKISSLDLSESGETKSATVTFEKETAAKTALLLDNTQLGPSQVTVTSDTSSTNTASATKGNEGSDDQEDVSQEDKPRSRILAEYLAHGYLLSDQVIAKGLALDQQHGISSRFTNALTNFDKKYQATDKTKAMDEKYAVSQKATGVYNGLYSYFDKAASTPTGQKLRDFYAQGSRQVLDVHNEARHLANLKSGATTKTGEGSTPTPSAEKVETEKVGDSDKV